MNLRATLDTLMLIEKMDVQVPRKPEKSVDKPANGKGKRKVSFKEYSLPQKGKHSSEFCALCDNHGGAKTTHNTGDCRKYEKYGVFKKTFKSQKGKSAVNKKIDNHSFKTMKDTLKKVKTKLKKIKKVSHKLEKRECNDSSASGSS